MMYTFRSISARARGALAMVSVSCHHVEVAAWGRCTSLNLQFSFMVGSEMCAQSQSGVLDHDV
jgi:hypothetical protein